jgi:hypothetical protein
MPWLERAERLLPVPFGLSLIAVARKPELTVSAPPEDRG